MMRGAREADRARRLSMAEAMRAGSQMDGDAFEKWVAAVEGQDRHLPPEALPSQFRQAALSLEVIDMDEALRRMH